MRDMNFKTCTPTYDHFDLALAHIKLRFKNVHAGASRSRAHDQMRMVVDVNISSCNGMAFVVAGVHVVVYTFLFAAHRTSHVGALTHRCLIAC